MQILGIEVKYGLNVLTGVISSTIAQLIISALKAVPFTSAALVAIPYSGFLDLGSSIIIVVLSIFTAGLLGYGYARLLTKVDKDKRNKQTIKRLMFPFVVYLIVIAVVALWPHATVISITAPSDGATVDIIAPVHGTAANVPAGQAIWIVVYANNADRYYPQETVIDLQANGQWSTHSHLGVNASKGETFDIMVVLADKQVQDTFNNYLANSRSQQDFSGLPTLPRGVVIYDSVTVTRR